MANIPIDPTQFVPHGFNILHVEGRTSVQRVILPRRARKHEDFTIASINPMPEGEVLFANVHEVLVEFLTQEARVGVKSIQRCPFGQAYVQFERIRDRDRLIDGSPHVFEDITISFCKHNEGVNWRRAHLDNCSVDQLSRGECWILMVGTPLDNWSTEDVTAIISKFGRLILWENDAENKGRIIAKIRCSELRDIPKSVRFTEGEQPEASPGHSLWRFCLKPCWELVPKMKILFQMMALILILCQLSLFFLLLLKLLLLMPGKIKLLNLLCSKVISIRIR
jgi:hypothetical protein